MTCEKKLAVFDFDMTIAAKNSDTEVVSLIPNSLTEDISRSEGWMAFMNKIFFILHDRNVNKSMIYDQIVNIPETNGMKELLNILYQELHYIIIISDANQIFIKDWLEANKIHCLFTEIFTNHAYYDDTGKLVVEPYQQQMDCKLCPSNLCKGDVMTKFIQLKAKEGIEYTKIIYAGDGSNDFCPMLRLSENDIAFPRIGYGCLKRIQKFQEDPEYSVKAAVCPWNDAYDILKDLKK